MTRQCSQAAKKRYSQLHEAHAPVDIPSEEPQCSAAMEVFPTVCLGYYRDSGTETLTLADDPDALLESTLRV